MEVDEVSQPKLEKMSSIASQEDIWPMMATEYDNDGYTPLLWACKIYRDFKVSKIYVHVILYFSKVLKRSILYEKLCHHF
jgi:hypothetical protein